MTKRELTLLIETFQKRLDKAKKIRDTTPYQIGHREYLQGGIDTLIAIIEGLEKRNKKLTSK